MPRNMSFSLTTEQMRNRTKTVTRRNGWWFLKPGDIVNACVKCMGLKPGEKIEVIRQIRIVKTTKEPLRLMIDHPSYGRRETAAEGFPGMEPFEFGLMFCLHMGGDLDTPRNRIEFEHIEDKAEGMVGNG